MTSAKGVCAAKNHSSYTSMVCTSALLRTLFCLIENKISSPGMKTEAIINTVLEPHSVEVALKAIHEIMASYSGVM